MQYVQYVQKCIKCHNTLCKGQKLQIILKTIYSGETPKINDYIERCTRKMRLNRGSRENWKRNLSPGQIYLDWQCAECDPFKKGHNPEVGLGQKCFARRQLWTLCSTALDYLMCKVSLDLRALEWWKYNTIQYNAGKLWPNYH